MSLAASLLCVLDTLLGLAILCLIVWLVYWVVTSLLGVSLPPIPERGWNIIKIVILLLVLIIIVRAALGDWCGFGMFARWR